mgnify:CR=1 FL=1
MHVDCDQCLVLCTIHLIQVLCGLTNQCVKQVQKLVVRFLHNFSIRSGLNQGRLRVTGPYHLNSKDSNLSLKASEELEEVKLVVIDEVECLSDDAMHRFLRCSQKRHQPYFHTALGSHRTLKMDSPT